MSKNIVILIVCITGLVAIYTGKQIRNKDLVCGERITEQEVKVAAQEQRIQALASRQASLEKELEATKKRVIENAEKTNQRFEQMAKVSLGMVALLERMEARIKALEKASKEGSFTGRARMADKHRKGKGDGRL